jgi:hypothetical protein
MASTVEELEKRVEALEREVATLRERVVQQGGANQTNEQATQDSAAEHAALVAAWDKAMEEMGIRGEPVGAEKLQQMMRDAGIRPEENLFSRGIIEMREE